MENSILFNFKDIIENNAFIDK